MLSRDLTRYVLRPSKEVEGLPYKYEEEDFDTFIVNDLAKPKKDACIEFSKVSSPYLSLVLSGSTGTGKTHLACALAKNNYYTYRRKNEQEQVKRLYEDRRDYLISPKALFNLEESLEEIRNGREAKITVDHYPTLNEAEQKELEFINFFLKQNHWKVKNARRKFVKATELFILFNSNAMDKMPLLNEINNCDLLVIDDFGADRQSDASRANLLTVLDKRYDNFLKTVITTNLPFDELNKLEPRITSRLSEYGINIVLAGDDYRKKWSTKRQG